MTRLRIENIGELFTGDLNAPVNNGRSLDVAEGVICAIGAPQTGTYDAVIDARDGAVMPGLIDGHVHPVFGEWTPTQDALNWIGNYLHGGTTTMVSAGELHVPGLDYTNLNPELVTSLAVVTAATTGRVRWSGVKVHAGTCLLVPGMNEDHFDRLAAAGSRLVKFIFFPLNDRREEALRYSSWCRERGIRVKVHTGGVSRSGLSQICGFETLAWLQPDVAAHVSGGPIPMPDDDLDRLVDHTDFPLEICSSGNDRSTLRVVRRLTERGRLHRLTLGTDTPGGTGVIPRGMFRQILYLSSVCGLDPGVAIACATGNTARAHGLDTGIIATGRPADLVVLGRIEGSTGPRFSDAIAHGDFPGISHVLIDGEVLVSGRSRQTPPPQRPALMSCCNIGMFSALSGAGHNREGH